MVRLASIMLAVLLLAACGDTSHRRVRPLESSSSGGGHDEVADELGVPSRIENQWGMQFVLVADGAFVMGAREGEDVDGIGGPETTREVSLSRPIYVQSTEVTNRQFRAWRAGHDSGECKVAAQGSRAATSLSANGDDQPVVFVSWDDAQEFALWLSASDPDRRYRLPTEAEWEYACRAGTRTPFSLGSSLSSEQANIHGAFPYGRPYGDPGSDAYQAKYRDKDPGTFRRVTLPVGSFQPNAWGLHDMHGNVREWCSDWHDLYPEEPATDPVGPPDGEYRVVRGGAWALPGTLARSAARQWSAPHAKSNDCGFRLVSPLPD